jgi:uncharacterized protein (DUF2267 family)
MQGGDDRQERAGTAAGNGTPRSETSTAGAPARPDRTPGGRPIPAEAPAADFSASPDTGGIRGFPPERQGEHPLLGSARVERRADAEGAASAAPDPLGPGGFVEPRDTTGGPATPLGERLPLPDEAPGSVDVMLEVPDAEAVAPTPAGGWTARPDDEPAAPPSEPAPLDSRWLEPFARSLQHTREWMRDVAVALGGSPDPRAAWHALHAVLPVLRDQLTPAEVADLCAQLPLLFRGLLLDDWTGQPRPAPDRATVLVAVGHRLGPRATHDAEAAVRAVSQVLRARVTPGEMADVLHVLRREVRELVE